MHTACGSTDNSRESPILTSGIGTRPQIDACNLERRVMATTTATGAGMSSTGTGKASRKHSPGKKQGTGFLANSKREMRIDYLGEATPGPGSYLPASTFGKHDKSLSKMSKVQSSAFRSGSSQRPKSRPSEVPGPGAHSPNHMATSSEKKKVRVHRVPYAYRSRRLTRSSRALVPTSTFYTAHRRSNRRSGTRAIHVLYMCCGGCAAAAECCGCSVMLLLNCAAP